jgi:hypothetical protein
MSDTDYPSSSASSHSSRRLDSSSLMSSSLTDTLNMSRSPVSSQQGSPLSSWSPDRAISVCSSPVLSSPREPSSPTPTSPKLGSVKLDSPTPASPEPASTPQLTSKKLETPQSSSPPPAISLPVSPTKLDRSPSPCWLMADMTFGRCQTPVSLPASRPLSPVIGLTVDDSDNSSSSSDEVIEAKRARLDPDYCPSTVSTSPVTTAGHSQATSEQEDEVELEESDTESGSWHPSGTTSPEIYSSPEDD